ncbi:MAG: DUF898 domain-containing protein [Methylophaga sp.]|nr:DUF898 domain-containing protein [Methylophaga sp.]
MKALEFNGSGTEYFKIWIVNILLTIVTLGIYHPWAKVRNRRYFYGNTELDNANFEYHATGKQLFFSYVIAMILFLAYVVLSQVSIVFSVAFPLIFIFVLPWILWRSIKFNLRMSSYRNVRFGFDGSLGGAYATFLGYPVGLFIAFIIVMAVIVGLIGSVMGMMTPAIILASILGLFFYPAYFAMINKISNMYFINGAQFGQGDFSTELNFKTFFGIAMKGMGLGLLLSFLAMIVIGIIAYLTIGLEQIAMMGEQIQQMEEGAEPDGMFLALIFGVYAVLILVSIYVAAYFKARHRTYVFGETSLDNSINFESTLRANKLFGIIMTNLLLMIVTLGLAYPWAVVRLYRYSIESINVGAPDGLDGYMSKAGNEGALGEELGDAFDIDVGGIAF